MLRDELINKLDKIREEYNSLENQIVGIKSDMFTNNVDLETMEKYHNDLIALYDKKSEKSKKFYSILKDETDRLFDELQTTSPTSNGFGRKLDDVLKDIALISDFKLK